ANAGAYKPACYAVRMLCPFFQRCVSLLLSFDSSFFYFALLNFTFAQFKKAFDNFMVSLDLSPVNRNLIFAQSLVQMHDLAQPYLHTMTVVKI
ncbi:MAG: hypothetical protein MR426_11045, partial [Clostridiales bacterium]|nr:hypothetical protein [Clostridiales bacterium]